MSNNHSNSALLGFVLGGLLAGASAAFLSTKTGKKLKDDLVNKCQECADRCQECGSTVQDKVEEFIENLQEKAGEYSDRLHEKSLDWSENADKISAFVKMGLDAISNPENKEFRDGLIVGGLIGGVLGVTSSLALHTFYCHTGGVPQSFIKQKMGSYKNIVNDVLQALHKESAKSPRAQVINDAMQLAKAGLRIWNKVRG